MKFKNYLESIAGVEIYPLFSLLVFVLFFATLLYVVLRADKNRINAMKNIPLNAGEDIDNK